MIYAALRYFAAIEPRERSSIEMVLPGRVLFLRPLKARKSVLLPLLRAGHTALATVLYRCWSVQPVG